MKANTRDRNYAILTHLNFDWETETGNSGLYNILLSSMDIRLYRSEIIVSYREGFLCMISKYM